VILPRDPTVISFDALPTCDGQTDGHAAYSYTSRSDIAQRDKIVTFSCNVGKRLALVQQAIS